MHAVAASASTNTFKLRTNLPGGAAVVTAVALGYSICFLVGTYLKPNNSPISLLWPPNAFLLSALILSPKRRWPLMLMTTLPIQLGIQVSEGVPWMTSLSWFISNCLEALIGAALIRRFVSPRNILSTFRGALIFLIFGVAVAPFLTSFTDVGGVLLTRYGKDFWTLWNERLYSNMASMVVFAPPIIAFVQTWLTGSFSVRKVVEAICIAALSIGVLLFIFHSPITSHEPLGLFLLLPLLLWSAVRFGSAGASTSLLTISLFTISETISGHGPFVYRIRMLQVFFVILTMPFLCLGAVIEERREIEKVSRANQQLSELLAEIASRFVNLRWDLIDEEIHKSVARVREYLQVDRLSVFERVDSECLHLFYSARAEGVSVPPDIVTIESVQSFGIDPNGTQIKLLSQDDPDVSATAAAFLESIGNRSVLAVPIPGDDHLQGFITVACDQPALERAASAGPLIKILGEVIFDGLERKRVSQSLAESEQRFRHIADHTSMLVWMSDADGVYTYINAAWINFTGLPSLQHDAAGWFRCIHPDDFERVHTEMESARARRAPVQIEYRFRRYDGEFRHILDTGVPRFSGNGSFLGYVGSALDVTELKRAEQLSSNFSGQLLLAQETERRRIARELHDDIGQRIALLAIELDRLKAQGGAADGPITKLLRDSKEISASLRDLSHNLHSTGVEVLPLATALRAFCKDFNNGHPDLHVTFSEEPVPAVLPYDVKLCFYRIAQECLQNVVKHSSASAVFLHLAVVGGNLKLTVIDNGVGFDVAKGRTLGLGIRSMRERVRLLGGTFRVESQEGAGAKIEASLFLEGSILSERIA
jgi:PAS domain S-box-containing protein